MLVPFVERVGIDLIRESAGLVIKGSEKQSTQLESRQQLHMFYMHLLNELNEKVIESG